MLFVLLLVVGFGVGWVCFVGEWLGGFFVGDLMWVGCLGLLFWALPWVFVD